MQALLGLSLEQLQSLCLEQGFPKFTAKQLCDWMYHKRVDNFDSMTNLSLKIRARLNEIATVGRTAPVDCQTSTDGTRKYLFAVHDSRFTNHNYIESVYIPDGDRATLCVSCQRGC